MANHIVAPQTRIDRSEDTFGDFRSTTKSSRLVIRLLVVQHVISDDETPVAEVVKRISKVVDEQEDGTIEPTYFQR